MTSLTPRSFQSAADHEAVTSSRLPPFSSQRKLLSPWRFPMAFHQDPAPPSRHRRRLLISSGIMVFPLMYQRAIAEEEGSKDKDEGLLGGLTSLFDPNEKTKSGRILPKSYLKSAREVVKSLRESLKEDTNDNAKFRRSADSAKESIRGFMQSWTGQKSVASEDSYTALEKAIRLLADFYSKKGPTAPLPEDIKLKVMDDLNSAEAAL